MCGFCGVINIDGEPVDVQLLREMTELISHRGPDDEGYLLINSLSNKIVSCYGDDTVASLKKQLQPLQNLITGNVGMGFRRLAIIDLSDNAHQPMLDKETETAIVFNGEIYNYLELRNVLKGLGHTFCTSSDTEVILKAYCQWELDCVNYFNGMWAFVIWDNKRNRIFCCRDRFGVKPFYYHFNEGHKLIFASEIKSILKMVNPRADLFSVNEFLTWSQLDHTKHTFFQDVNQLRGGHSLLLQGCNLKIEKYYDLKTVPISEKRDQAIEQFRQTLFDSVKLRLRSDVPVGFAMSGGLDSSSIVSIAKEYKNIERLNTFSVVFPNTAQDESKYVRMMTDFTGVHNHSISPNEDSLLSVMDEFVWHQEEPNNGSSYLAEYLLRKSISESKIKVTLEGQGADEIISGYRPLIHFYLQDLLKDGKYIKYIRESILLNDITSVGAKHFIANLAAVYSPGLYRLLRRWQLRRVSDFVLPEFVSAFRDRTVEYQLTGKYSSHLNQKLYQYLFETSLPPQLVRADKSSMAFSLECRFPFLDYNLVELAFSLPYNMKINNGVTKYVLREAMKNHLPMGIYKRRDKLGFPTPENAWMRGKLKGWVMDSVYSTEFKSMPFLNWYRFEKRLEHFMRYGGDWGAHLWSILSVYNWHKSYSTF